MNPNTLEEQAATHVGPVERALTAVTNVTARHGSPLLGKFLHGTFMGHPLHAAVVAVPIGAYTTATVLDGLDLIQDNDRFAAAAKAAVGLGLLSTGLAAASGLADWSTSEGKGRQVGVVHSLFNLAATAALGASFLLRKDSRRKEGAVATNLLGFALLMVGGYLGGQLAYKYRIGMDHADRRGPLHWVPVYPESELPEGEPHLTHVGGVNVVVVKQHGRIFALGDVCAHSGASLSEGRLEDGAIRCPRSGSLFRLEDGAVLEGPSAFAQPLFTSRINGGMLELRLLERH